MYKLYSAKNLEKIEPKENMHFECEPWLAQELEAFRKSHRELDSKKDLFHAYIKAYKNDVSYLTEKLRVTEQTLVLTKTSLGNIAKAQPQPNPNPVQVTASESTATFHVGEAPNPKEYSAQRNEQSFSSALPQDSTNKSITGKNSCTGITQSFLRSDEAFTHRLQQLRTLYALKEDHERRRQQIKSEGERQRHWKPIPIRPDLQAEPYLLQPCPKERRANTCLNSNCERRGECFRNKVISSKFPTCDHGLPHIAEPWS